MVHVNGATIVNFSNKYGPKINVQKNSYHIDTFAIIIKHLETKCDFLQPNRSKSF